MEVTHTKLLHKQALAFSLLILSRHTMGDTAAESIWLQRDGISVSVGLFLPNYDTTVRKSKDSTSGSEIDLENDLGLESDDEIPVFSIAARPWSKHKFFFSHMAMDRDAKQTLKEDLTFDGITFPAGTNVDTEFNIDMYRAGYTWAFLQNESWELGLSMGAYWVNMDMKVGSVDGDFTTDYNESEPFPMVGFSGSWLINDDWLIRGTAEAFSIEINDTEGDFYNVRLEGEYALTEHLSIGAGYDLVGIDAKDNKINNKVNYDYHGALIFLRWIF